MEGSEMQLDVGVRRGERGGGRSEIGSGTICHGRCERGVAGYLGCMRGVRRCVGLNLSKC